MPIAISEGGNEMPIRLLDTDYWRARDIRKLSPRTRHIYWFLLGCPAGDLSGLFQYDLDEFILQTGWTEDQWEESLDELKKAGKAKTENGDLMWLVNALHREPNKGIKTMIHCAKQLTKFRKHDLVKQYVQHYSQYFELEGDEVVLVDAPAERKTQRKKAPDQGVDVDLGEPKTTRKKKGRYIEDQDLEAWIEDNLWKPYPVPQSGRGSKRKTFQRVAAILGKGMDTKEGLVRAVSMYRRKREGEDPKYTTMAEGFFNPDHERWRELGAPLPEDREAQREREKRHQEASALQESITAGLCKTMPGSGGES